MTKAKFYEVAKGRHGQFGYPNGNCFFGEVIVKSRAINIGGLNIEKVDIVKVEMNSSGIEITTKNGFGFIQM